MFIVLISAAINYLCCTNFRSNKYLLHQFRQQWVIIFISPISAAMTTRMQRSMLKNHWWGQHQLCRQANHDLLTRFFSTEVPIPSTYTAMPLSTFSQLPRCHCIWKVLLECYRAKISVATAQEAAFKEWNYITLTKIKSLGEVSLSYSY